eukprot:CAMPEP_0174287686 /NCGR_PEP_ID=MMETSP0809-20121228/17028_1 /TAXON_ID=73025 ORGANISM="Eutreptiella gymnastica-like, Strain CCMP1594" /NCGR_SAMPLE_ID=MMETSP0809 /ASSEMBLY_ACC=CAM_ASM_000658 /LENGTH=61 /DNA_ID=CAMNT_0015384383 /DNA_START=1061 /DNA_END=1246 /DNA_ORIENTATION=+
MPLGPDEAAMRVLLRHGHQRVPVPTPDVKCDLLWTIPAESLRKIQRLGATGSITQREAVEW